MVVRPTNSCFIPKLSVLWHHLLTFFLTYIDGMVAPPTNGYSFAECHGCGSTTTASIENPWLIASLTNGCFFTEEVRVVASIPQLLSLSLTMTGRWRHLLTVALTQDAAAAISHQTHLLLELSDPLVLQPNLLFQARDLLDLAEVCLTKLEPEVIIQCAKHRLVLYS